MSEQSLVDWVRQVKPKTTHEDLLKRLRAAGWSQEIIDDVIAEASKPVVTSVPSLRSDGLVQMAVAAGSTVIKGAFVGANPNTFDGFNTLDLGDRKAQVVFEMEVPRVVVVDNFMSSEECDLMIERARPQLTRSTVVEHGTANSVVDPVRTSQGMFFGRQQDEFIKTIENRVSEFVNWPVENGEGFQVLKYGPEEEYKPHNDYFNPNDPASASNLSRNGQRVATVLIYLNDVEAGGGTSFPESKLEIKPRKGSAIFFGYPSADSASKTLHGGSPVLRGEKWVCVKWFREKQFS